jgi:hypothetical protein
MLDYLQGAFDWLVRVGGKFLEGIFDVVRRFKWFVVALVAALLAPIEYVLKAVLSLTEKLLAQSEQVLASMDALMIPDAQGLWSQLASGAALMNCVVPLNTCLSVAGVLLTLWLTIFTFKVAAWVYRHLPKFAGFGTGG